MHWGLCKGSPCLENGGCRKRDAKSEVWEVGKGKVRDRVRPQGASLILLAIESVWEDLIRI